MRIPHALLIAGLLLPVSSSDVACAGRPPQREPIVSRKGSPIPPVEEEGSGWTGLIARARKALDARQPEKVLELLETPTIEDKAPPPEAVQLLARAYLAFDRGDDAEAVVDHGLKGQPNSRELKAIRADLEVSLGKRKLEEGVYKLARGHFQKALAGASQTGPGRQLRENIAAAYRESARALEATGDHERAVAVLKESLELDPENPPSIRLLGTVLRGAGRTRDAISFYELYLMYEPEDREMADELIQLYREVGDEAKAVGLASRFPAPSPAVSGQPPTLASTEEAAASPDSAIEDELAVARDDRERADVYLKWGKASSSEKDYPRATELLRKGLEMNPASRDLLLALADVLRLSRKPAEARRLYETRLEIEPKDHAVRLLLAKLLVATGGSKDALRHLKQLSVEPSLDRALMLEAYNWLGIAHAQTNDYAAAEDAWNEVLKIDAQHANAHYNLGQVRERQLKFKEAIAAFEKAVEFGTKDPDYLRYLERLGMAYRQAGQRQAAVDVWKRLAAAAPAGSPLADRARRFQAEQGVTQREMEAATPSGARPAEASRWRRTEAATHARLPDAPAPKDAEFLTAAEKAFRQGAPDEAIRQYNNALNADPTNLDTYFKLGDLLHQKGAIAQERALFQQMLAQKLPPDLEQAARYRLQGLGDASASEGTVRQEIGR